MIIDLREQKTVFHEIIRFPDNSLKFKLYATGDKSYNVLTTLRSNDDLILLGLVKDVLDRYSEDISLTITYMMYQQDDRLFNENESFGLKVISNYINSLSFKKVFVNHPHSDKVEMINNCYITNNALFITKVTENLSYDEFVWVIPDAGAFKSQFKLIPKKVDFVTCMKSRSEYGDITTVVGVPENLKNRKFIIFDDICLGGATFISIAEKLIALGVDDIELAVSHGIFNKGLDHLRPYFSKIYTTKSICQLTEDNFLKII